MESFFETACARLPEEARTRLRDSMPAQGGLKLEYVADSAYLFS